MTMEGGEPFFDWGVLVPHVVHPVKVAIVEAMLWIGRPLSASDIARMLDGEFTVSFVSYHVRELARMKAIRRVRRQRVRGAVKSFYFFSELD